MAPMAGSRPELSVVVSTYNRPDVLRVALASLCRQTHRDWNAIVIGDCCDPRTAEAVATLDDRRIRYFNLPVRCGDQSGPNSVGAALSDSPYIAFLNHDDVLVPDHFERCLNRLRETSADVCIAGRVRVVRWMEGGDDRVVQYDVLAPDVPRLRNVIVPEACSDFEPVSAWLMRTESYRRVGDWHDGSDLYRTPLNDWLLRATVAGLRFVLTDTVSVVNLATHYAQGPLRPAYLSSDRFHQQVENDLQSGSPDAFRTRIRQQKAHPFRARVSPRWRSFLLTPLRAKPRKVIRFAARVFTWPLWRCLRQPLAVWFTRSGHDPYELFCRIRRRPKGIWKAAAIRYRTGDAVPARADRAVLVAAARAWLNSTP